MLELLVCSPDERFLERMVMAVAGEGIVATIRDAAAAAQLLRRRRFDIVIMDVRSVALDVSELEVSTLRAGVAMTTRIIGVATLASQRSIRVVTRAGADDLDVLFDDADIVPDMLRAFANDASRTIAAAETLNVLRGCFKPRADELATICLSGGFRVSSVDETARYNGISADALEARFAAEGSPPPKLVLRAIHSAYAAVLLRLYGSPWRSIAAWCRCGNDETLKRHMKQCFGDHLMSLRLAQRGEPAAVVIRPLIVQWLAGQRVAKRRKPRSRKTLKQASKQASIGRIAG